MQFLLRFGLSIIMKKAIWCKTQLTIIAVIIIIFSISMACINSDANSNRSKLEFARIIIPLLIRVALFLHNLMTK